jgi:NADH:ubiquinone oxidoreductase subunit 2 (subunit N)
LPTTNIIILLSFIFLLFLIFLFIKNYFIKKIIFSMLINKVASLLILILINFTLFNFLCNFNSSVILYQSFIFFIIFILLLSLYSCSGNHIYNSQEFIILSFIILFLSLILVASANDDFALFLICLEGFSLTLYIMTTLNKTFGSISAAIKYFTFGTLGSIIMF